MVEISFVRSRYCSITQRHSLLMLTVTIKNYALLYCTCNIFPFATVIHYFNEVDKTLKKLPNRKSEKCDFNSFLSFSNHFSTNLTFATSFLVGWIVLQFFQNLNTLPFDVLSVSSQSLVIKFWFLKPLSENFYKGVHGTLRGEI